MENRILIDRWKTAYKKANNRPAPEIRYNHSWYYINNAYSSPIRERKLLKMAQTLENRISMAVKE